MPTHPEIQSTLIQLQIVTVGAIKQTVCDIFGIFETPNVCPYVRRIICDGRNGLVLRRCVPISVCYSQLQLRRQDSDGQLYCVVCAGWILFESLHWSGKSNNFHEERIRNAKASSGNVATFPRRGNSGESVPTKQLVSSLVLRIHTFGGVCRFVCNPNSNAFR